MANILIVEDEKNMQDIIAEYVKKGGHTCFTADDGIDALSSEEERRRSALTLANKTFGLKGLVV